MSALVIDPSKIRVASYFPTGFEIPSQKKSDSAESSTSCDAKVDFTVKDSSYNAISIDEPRRASVSVTNAVDGVYILALRAEFKSRSRELCDSDRTQFIVAFNEKELGVVSTKISRGALSTGNAWRLANNNSKQNVFWKIHDGDSYRLNDYHVCTATLVAVVGAADDECSETKRKRGRPSKRACPYCATGPTNVRKTGVEKPVETISALKRLLLAENE